MKEYWMVDPDKKHIIVYVFEESELPTIYGFDSEVPVAIFGGDCKIDFKEIYEYILFLYD